MENYSFLVGKVAETLVEQLFVSLGYDVFPYGMEQTVPEIRKRLAKRVGPCATQIRNMPDFVAIGSNNIPFFIEVKYRSSGEFDINDLRKQYEYYPFDEVLLVLVSPRHIKAEFVENLEFNPITSNSRNYLGNVPEFDFTREEKDKIVNFCKYATHFFDGVRNL